MEDEGTGRSFEPVAPSRELAKRMRLDVKLVAGEKMIEFAENL